jgi:hypothetical protein
MPAYARPFLLLDAVTTEVASDHINLGTATFISVQLVGMLAGDEVALEVCNILGEWESAVVVTGDGVYIVEAGARFLRARVSDDTGGGAITAEANVRFG